MYRLFLVLMVSAASAIAGDIDQPAALAALQRPGSILIDVRTAKEHADGALPGSTRIEPQNLAERIADVAPDKHAPVIVYCRTGRRSSAAQDLLQQLGYSQVINAGGYEDLKQAVPPR